MVRRKLPKRTNDNIMSYRHLSTLLDHHHPTLGSEMPQVRAAAADQS
jgi:hypothetical protein